MTLREAAQRELSNKSNVPFLLEEQECKAIKEAVESGHRDPRLDEDLIKTLFPNYPDKTYRRFITSFDYEDPHQLTENQTNAEAVDVGWCNEQLIPSIRKDGKILDPIMVDDNGNIAHGHNRNYSGKKIDPDAFQPVFGITGIYKLNTTTGSYVPNTLVYQDYKSRTVCNARPKNRVPKMEDAVSNITNLFGKDPFFDTGYEVFNPSGKFPDRHEGGIFDAVMDDLYPGWFLDKATRTKIYNGIKRGNYNSKVLPYNRETALRESGYGSGLNDKGKAHSFGKHQEGDTIVGTVSSNGKDFERNIVHKVLTDFIDGNIGSDVKTIELVIEIYKPEHNLTGVNSQRSTMVKRVAEANRRFGAVLSSNVPGARCPVINKLWFPKVLTDIRDKGKAYSWCPTTKDFKEEKK